MYTFRGPVIDFAKTIRNFRFHDSQELKKKKGGDKIIYLAKSKR